MNSTSELIIVGIVVAAALIWAGRASWRSFRKTSGCSSCATSGDCPLVKDPEDPISLIDISTGCEQTGSTEPISR